MSKHKSHHYIYILKQAKTHCQHESRHLPSSLRERSSILIFCKASSSSTHLERSFSKASFMSQYCMGTAGWGCGARAPLVVVPTSSRRLPNIPLKKKKELKMLPILGTVAYLLIYYELFKDLSLTFFFFVGWSILAWRKSISLVCWEMVPSIFTFSWEYTACRKEQRHLGRETIRNTTRNNKFSLHKNSMNFFPWENVQISNILHSSHVYSK